MSFALVVNIRTKPETRIAFMQKLADAVPLLAARDRTIMTRLSH